MAFEPTDVFIFLGRRRSGKSHLAKRVSGAYPRKVIFDTLGEYDSSDGTLCLDFDDFCKKVLETEKSDSFTLIYQFDIESSDQTEEFNEAMRVLYYRGDVFVLIEEVQNFASTHSMPHWLRQALFTGRHRHLALGFTTQRPGECHKSIVSQANHCFFGSLHEKNDTEYCKTVLGSNAQLLAGLPEREFIYFQPGNHALQRLSETGQLKNLDTESISP